MMTDAGWHKLSSARDQFRKVLLSYWVLVKRWSTSAKVPNTCMKWWLTLGNVRLRWPPISKSSQTVANVRPQTFQMWTKIRSSEREFHQRLDHFSKHFKVGAMFAQTFAMWVYLYIFSLITYSLSVVRTGDCWQYTQGCISIVITCHLMPRLWLSHSLISTHQTWILGQIFPCLLVTSSKSTEKNVSFDGRGTNNHVTRVGEVLRSMNQIKRIAGGGWKKIHLYMYFHLISSIWEQNHIKIKMYNILIVNKDCILLILNVGTVELYCIPPWS